MTGFWSGGRSCGTEPFVYGIWFYLWADSVRNELNFCIPASIQELIVDVGKSPHTHIGTGSRNPTQTGPKKKTKLSIITPIHIKWYCKQFLKNYNGVNEEKPQTPQSQLYDLIMRIGASSLTSNFVMNLLQGSALINSINDDNNSYSACVKHCVKCFRNIINNPQLPISKAGPSVPILQMRKQRMCESRTMLLIQ